MLVCMKNTSKFVVRFYELRNTTNMFSYMINQKIHIYKYDQSFFTNIFGHLCDHHQGVI